MTEIEDLIREYGTRFLNEQSGRAEADLRTVIGSDVEIEYLHPDYIKSLGLEVVWQRGPDNGFEFYRGLRQHGLWLFDHFPSWPFEPDD